MGSLNIKNIIGVDYSMRCPCLCSSTVSLSENFNDCVFHYLTDKKKSVFPSKQFVGQLHKEYSTQEERFNNISNWTLDIILSIKEPIVFLEDYSYASKGMIFSIGENTGALKSKLWLAKIPFILVQPSKVKKTFSGKGNANKEAMYTEFVKQTNMDLLKYYSSITNPASDIVDSYAIYKYGMSNYK